VANVTISIDDALLREARARAAAEGTSLQNILRGLVAVWLQQDAAQEEAIAGIRDLLDAGEYDSGGVRWSREELYEGMLR